MFFAFWIFLHFLSYVVLVYANNKFIRYFLILQYIIFYCIKPSTYDLVHYLDYSISDDSNYFEPVSHLFLKVAGFLSILTTIDSNIYIVILMICIIYYPFYNFSILQNKIMQGHNVASSQIIILVFSSIFFFLSSQNVVRQGISFALFSFSALYLKKRQYLYSLFFLFLAFFAHYGNFPLVILMLLFYFFSAKFNTIMSFTTGLIVGVLNLIILFYIFSDNSYLISDFSIGNERSSIVLKWFAIFLIMFFSTVIFKYNKIRIENTLLDFIKLRAFIFGLLTSIFIFDLSEMFTRVSLSFYLLDLLIVCLISASKNVRVNLLLLFYITIYSFAPNVFNILTYEQ